MGVVYIGIIWESLKKRMKRSKRFSSIIESFQERILKRRGKDPKVATTLPVTGNDGKSFISKVRRDSFALFDKGNELIPRSFKLFNKGNDFLPCLRRHSLNTYGRKVLNKVC
jgi:hypothetical protein